MRKSPRTRVGKLFLKGHGLVDHTVSATTQLYYSTKAAISKSLNIIIFQRNFIYKNRKPVN